MSTTNGGPEPQTDLSQMAMPRIGILTQYVKDFWFENPNAPRSLGPNQQQPAINVNIAVEAAPLQRNRRRSHAATGRQGRSAGNRGGRIAGVETARGRIATDTVVCCAGMWSKEVGALAGAVLPVEGEARSMWFTPQDGGLPERLPLTIDFSSGFYFHREGPGLAFGGRERSLEDVAVAAARQAAGARRPACAVVVVGLVRREPRLERARRRGSRSRRASSTRRASRARLPAGARRR